MSLTVFISYASPDRAAAQRIFDGLESRQLGVWMAPQSIPLGGTYGPAIIEGIRTCDVFVVLISRKSAASSHVEREAVAAIEHHKRIVPVVIEADVDFGRLAYYLAGEQRLVCPNGIGQNELDRLAAMVSPRGVPVARPAPVIPPRTAPWRRPQLIVVVVALAGSVAAGLSLLTSRDVPSGARAPGNANPQQQTSPPAKPTVPATTDNAAKLPATRPSPRPTESTGPVAPAPGRQTDGHNGTNARRRTPNATTPLPSQETVAPEIVGPAPNAGNPITPPAVVPPPPPAAPGDQVRAYVAQLQRLHDHVTAKAMLRAICGANLEGAAPKRIFDTLDACVRAPTSAQLERATTFIADHPAIRP
jgi:hypothetical protein